MDPFPITRREATRLIGGAAAAALWPMQSTAAEKAVSSLLLRAIPSTGEKIPAIGLGTSGTFDVGDSPNDRNPLKEVLKRFVQLGGKVIDTSPMYGRAETVIGDLVSELHLRDALFFATKVWTTGRQSGSDSMERSLALLRAKQLDLMQVHNLVDLDTQLATARA
jgi:diketogulonate reductase-like aldo/keto reductase